MKTRVIVNFGIVITISLTSASVMLFNTTINKLLRLSFMSPANAQQEISDFSVCSKGCLQFPTDPKFRNYLIEPKIINKLPKWDNICKGLPGNNPCLVVKSYKFKNGIIYLKVYGTESLLTDIKFNSSINQEEAIRIAQVSFNNGLSFIKKKQVKNRTIFYSDPFEDGKETIFLQEIHLIFNSQNKVNRIVSISTTP
ncbi:MAG: hypothetical protein AN487_12605 [Anabaena sp. CRKS33]|jgi:hypothetical protein|nr:MAG: hypothetical protein AN487_12605 [Anabaena sp. CRKS33]